MDQILLRPEESMPLPKEEADLILKTYDEYQRHVFKLAEQFKLLSEAVGSKSPLVGCVTKSPERLAKILSPMLRKVDGMLESVLAEPYLPVSQKWNATTYALSLINRVRDYVLMEKVEESEANQYILGTYLTAGLLEKELVTCNSGRCQNSTSAYAHYLLFLIKYNFLKEKAGESEAIQDIIEAYLKKYIRLQAQLHYAMDAETNDHASRRFDKLS